MTAVTCTACQQPIHPDTRAAVFGVPGREVAWHKACLDAERPRVVTPCERRVGRNWTPGNRCRVSA